MLDVQNQVIYKKQRAEQGVVTQNARFSGRLREVVAYEYPLTMWVVLYFNEVFFV